MATKHGFLQNQGNLSAQGLVEQALKAGLTHLWIDQGSLRIEDAQFTENYDVFRPLPVNKGTKLVSSLTVRRINPRTENTRVIWLKQTSWPYENWPQFRALIDGIEGRLGVQMSGSPTSVGLRFLEKIDKRYYKRYFADPDVDKAEMKALFRDAAKPMIWCRQPTKRELEFAYIIAVDKRAAYPRASLESVGIGKPEPYTGPFNHLLPGAWDVEVRGLEKMDPLLPPPLWDGWQNGTLVTPIVHMLKSMGCEIKVNEAMVWKQKAPVFDRWAKELWTIRQDIPGLKAVMNNTLGFTINGNDLDDEKFRPDWHAQIVGYLRSLMIYNAAKTCREGTLRPLGCYIDALYYLSPYKAIPGLLMNEKSLGGYAMKWCLPLTDEIKDIITNKDEQKHFNMMLSKLNAIAERTKGEN